MRFFKSTFPMISLVVLHLSACSSDSCFDFASDQLKLADSVVHKDQVYYLYVRTSGFQEKVIYFEIFDAIPTYDACTGKTTPNSLYGTSYDFFASDADSKGKYVKSINFQPNQLEKLKVIYTTDVNEGYKSVYDVKLTP